MYYQLASWEKIARNVYRNGNTIIIQHMKFLTSPDAYIVGGFLLVFAAIYLLSLYFGGLMSLRGLNPILVLQALLGIGIIIKGQQGVTQRKENMGVHPSDTLFVFDGANQTIIKQQNLLPETLASLKEITLSLEKIHAKHTRYVINMTKAEKKTRLITLHNKKEAEELLQTIKTTLNLT